MKDTTPTLPTNPFVSDLAADTCDLIETALALMEYHMHADIEFQKSIGGMTGDRHLQGLQTLTRGVREAASYLNEQIYEEQERARAARAKLVAGGE